MAMSRAKTVFRTACVVVGLSLFGLLVPKAGAEPEFRSVTLKLGGQSCADHVAESGLLRLRGVVMVDIEARPGYAIVDFDSSRVSVPHMLQAVARKSGENKVCTAQLVAG
jgi:hypothetical protein